MREMEQIRTYVAIGDSFTEGLNDPYPGEDDVFRGWADRLAEHIAEVNPGLRYANLAVRGKLVRQIVDDQVPPPWNSTPTWSRSARAATT